MIFSFILTAQNYGDIKKLPRRKENLEIIPNFVPETIKKTCQKKGNLPPAGETFFPTAWITSTLINEMLRNFSDMDKLLR